jgi:hypothetical protein
MTDTVHKRAKRIALLASTAALCGVVAATAANAAPREWDIEAYDTCKNRAEFLYLAGVIGDQALLDEYERCCVNSGGVYVNPPGVGTHCATAKEAVKPSDLPSHTFTPVPVRIPPGVMTPSSS